MVQQLYLFTGEDEYRLDRELSRWTTWFEDKHGEGSVLSFRGERDVGDVLSQLQWGGLFAQERMIVIDGVPLDNGSGDKRRVSDVEPLVDQLKRLVEQRPTDLWVLCRSIKPDKRTSDYKRMKRTATIKEYKPLTPAKLRKWLMAESPDTLTSDQYDQLIQRVGTDTRRALSEVDKIQRWMRSHNVDNVSDDMFRDIVSGDGDVDAFAFVHLVFREEVSQAIQLIDAVRDSGAYWVMFWGSATWWLRLLIPLIEGVRDGMNAKQLAKALKAPPFGVAKLMKLAQAELDRDGGQRVREFFETMIGIEYGVKSGTIAADNVWGRLKVAIASIHEASRA